jgi:F-type H+-transporting ATPase subunit delta
VSSQRLDSLAVVYAEALAQAAEAQGGQARLVEIGEALEAYGGAWARDRNVRAYFLSSFTPRAKREATLVRWLADAPPLFQDFVMLLLRRGRGRYLAEIAEAYAELLDERLGRVPVVLTTALPVPPAQLEDWIDRIRRATGKEPVVEHVVDGDLVAGAILRVGDAMVDGSIRRRITKALAFLRERSKLHALQS